MGCFVRSGSRLLRASPQRMKKTGKSHPEDLGKKLVFHCSRAPRARREGTVWSNSPPANQSIFFFFPFYNLCPILPLSPWKTCHEGRQQPPDPAAPLVRPEDRGCHHHPPAPRHDGARCLPGGRRSRHKAPSIPHALC